ncbi:hypothetical protein ACH4XT_13850 [Streptomyces avidinii]|uniref:hypothetical protein n=1 Tax=Streptomyces avidinii TaxID=1895 RepID=UPI0037A485CB|nr:hypothetical protein OG592_25110 [Streptomyces avidinii]
MRRGLLHAMAWTLATGAAVTLSWWGVHTVMSGTAYDPPLAVPLAARPLSSSTHDAQESRSPSGSASASPSASPSPSGSPGPDASSPSAGATPEKSPKPSDTPRGYQPAVGQDAGKVQAYPVSGGRVVFSLGASTAELVSATPAAGWRMQVWKQDFWIRVTFTRDGREVSVFCTWHDHPPMVEIVDP